MRKKQYFVLTIIVIFMLLSSSCRRERPGEDEETEILTHWIWDVMNEVYLWADEISSSLFPKNETDPEAYFYKLLHPDDRFSWIVDDIDALEASFKGIELSNGISPGWAGIQGSNDVIAIVEFVYENSPAADSGIRRGDIIMEVNGEKMTRSDYISKFYRETATYSFGELTATGLRLNGEQITLQAVELEQNPVQHHEIIDYEGKKIGYLVYTQFTEGKDSIWLNELNAVLQNFKTEPIDAFILDIRYNPGGSVAMAEHIASSLVPEVNVNNRDIFTRFIWNDNYNKFFKESDLDKDGKPDGENSPWLVIRFFQNNLNLGLSKVHILTSYRSASACELLISGIEVYTEVVHVGDTTLGKFYGSDTFGDTENPPRHKWAMQPIIFKYTNAEFFSDFTEGLFPDYPIIDYLINAVPFGDLRDPMLAKALEDITGVASPVKKITGPGLEIPYVSLPDPIKERKGQCIIDLKKPVTY
ncbi:MAG: PDZ domain-containing protein [Bacteroidales bacterium]|nr:PDZ domain-containing protein [Bacteroidales bacterium]